MISTDTTRLIETYLAGDVQTFREVNGWILATLGKHYGRMRADHEDIAQVVHQSLLSIFREGHFDARSALRTYVVRIVHHRAIDRIRQGHRERALAGSLPEDLPPGSPYDTLDRMDRDRQLHQALIALPQRCRELWRMVFVEKLPYDEIGRRLSIPPGTVKSRMWHCRRQAAEFVERSRRAPEGEANRLNPAAREAPLGTTRREE